MPRPGYTTHRHGDRDRRPWRVPSIEEDPQTRTCRSPRRERTREQQSRYADREDDRPEDEHRVAFLHLPATVLRVGERSAACAAMMLAMPRRASAKTVVPSTKKKASAASLEAAATTLFTAAANSSPRSSS